MTRIMRIQRRTPLEVSMLYSIRKAQIEDIPVLQEIEQAASGMFSDTRYAYEVSAACLSKDFLKDAISSDSVFTAVDGDNTPIGFAVVVQLAFSAHLHELSVHPQHSRRGIGRRLVDASIRYCRDLGLDRLTLSTYRDIPWNEPFYSSLGFKTIALSDLDSHLLAVRDQEAREGLDIDRRVMMEFRI